MLRKYCFFCLLLLFFTGSLAQTRYEEGYFIDNANITTKCFIYNVEWLNNPEEFKYKLQPDGEVHSTGLASVKEFGVAQSKYIRADIKVDTSTNVAKNLGHDRDPEWKNMQGFLEVVVEGKASLYSFRTPYFERFFYSVDGSDLEQLVYKQFLVEPPKRMFQTTPLEIRENLTYLQQLKTNVACDPMTDQSLKKIGYKKADLAKHFQNFNTCHGGESVKRGRQRVTNISIHPGIDFANFKFSDGLNYDKEYESAMSFRLGIMAEFILPFNNGKWSVLFEPTYQSYASEDRVSYQSIELPLGVRHHFFLSENSRLFLNGLFVLDKPLKYELRWSDAITFESKATSASFAAGAGVKIGKFSVEVRKYFVRSVGIRSTQYFFVHDKFSCILGFQIK